MCTLAVVLMLYIGISINNSKLHIVLEHHSLMIHFSTLDMDCIITCAYQGSTDHVKGKR